MSFIFSIMFLSLTIALFAWRISKRRRIDPSDFGIGENVFNKDIHPFTGSMIFIFNSRFSSFSTLLLV